MEEALKALFASDVFWAMLAEELANRITVETSEEYSGAQYPQYGERATKSFTTKISLGDKVLAEIHTYSYAD